MTFSFFLFLSYIHPATVDFKVQQKPRFYGTKVGKRVGFSCVASDLTLGNAVVTWHKVEKYDEGKVYNNLKSMPPFKSSRAVELSGGMKGQLFIMNAEVKDSGIYYCSMNKTWGLGTELQVFSKSALIMKSFSKGLYTKNTHR